MNLPPTKTDQALGFLTKHKALIGAGIAGIGFAGYGVYRGFRDTEGEPLDERLAATAHQAAGVGLVGAAAVMAGTTAYPLLKSPAKRFGSWYSGGITSAFKEKSIMAALSHGPLAMTLGGVVGGVVGGMAGDDWTDAAKGAAVGAMVTPFAVRAGSRMMSDWKSLGEFRLFGKAHPMAGSLAKGSLLMGGAVATGMVARAYMHEPEYEGNDTAVADGMGGYEYTSGPRDRMAMMNATGDVVLGLHNKRH